MPPTRERGPDGRSPMSDPSDVRSWHRPIPGDTQPIGAEIQRLTLLRDRWWAVADLLNGLDVQWIGESGEAFACSKSRIVGHWRTAGDLYDRAVQALVRYHEARLDLQGRASEIARSVAHGNDPVNAAAAWDDIQRLNAQFQTLAHEAGREISQCAMTLEGFRRTLGPSSPATASTPGQQSGIGRSWPVPAEPTPFEPARTELGAIDLDDVLSRGDRGQIEQNVRVLAAEILVGVHTIMDCRTA